MSNSSQSPMFDLTGMALDFLEAASIVREDCVKALVDYVTDSSNIFLLGVIGVSRSPYLPATDKVLAWGRKNPFDGGLKDPVSHPEETGQSLPVDTTIHEIIDRYEQLSGFAKDLSWQAVRRYRDTRPIDII